MKILLLPENNSLSHIAKCLVIKNVFESVLGYVVSNFVVQKLGDCFIPE
jgi:hypothetical protein